MHQSLKGILSTRHLNNNQPIKAGLVSSFDSTIPLSPVKNVSLRVDSRQKKKHPLQITSPRNQENSDSLPSFGQEARGIKHSSRKSPKFMTKNNLSQDFQNENLARQLRKGHKKPINTSQSHLSEDFSSKIMNRSQTSRIANVSTDLKQSNSYLNAMKALQLKIKKAEQKVVYSEQEMLDLEEKHQMEVDILTQRFNEERNSLLDAEKNLKKRLNLMEEESREREKMINSLGYENENLRKTLHQVESDRNSEVEQLINEKGRMKGEYRELEGKYEEMRTRNIQLEYAVGEKDKALAGLREKMSLFEKEKIETNIKLEQRLKEKEEKHRKLETKYREANQKNRDEETEKEIIILKIRIQELEERNEELEMRVKEQEMELVDKSARILKSEEEMENMLQEQQKAMAANYRTHHYAQGMAQMNQRLLSSLREKSRSPTHFNEHSLRKNLHHTVSTQLPNDFVVEDSLYGDFNSKHHQSRGLEENEQINSNFENRRVFKTPNSPDKNAFNMKGWSMGSPNYHEGESFYQGPRLNGEDLAGSGENGRLRPYEEGSRSKIKVKDLMGRYENREMPMATPMEKVQHEMIIKEIIDTEKESLELNREYQKLTNDIMGLNRDSSDFVTKKKRMEEISSRLQEKSMYLIQLKKKESDIASRLKL